ncbi:cell division protein FtsQ/DivIB [Thermodesulfobacteriota bacterium]
MKRKRMLTNRPDKRRRKKPASPNKLIGWIGTGIFRLSLIIGVMFVLSVSFVFIYNYLLNSPHLRLGKIVVEGVGGAIKNDILALAGLEKGISIMAINLDEVKMSLEEHPWIRSIELTRHFPHTIVIKAEKHVPIAVIALSRMYYLNRHGEVFKRVSDSEFVDLPVITGISEERFSAEEELSLAYQIIKFLEKQQRPLSLSELSEIHIRSKEGVSLYFNKMSAEIKTEWDGINNKMDNLRKVLEHLDRTGRIRKAVAIDLNYSKGILVSFKNG